MKTATFETTQGKKTVEYDENFPCVHCGLPVFEASVGGTAVCPWCDAGYARPESAMTTEQIQKWYEAEGLLTDKILYCRTCGHQGRHDSFQTITENGFLGTHWCLSKYPNKKCPQCQAYWIDNCSPDELKRYKERHDTTRQPIRPAENATGDTPPPKDA